VRFSDRSGDTTKVRRDDATNVQSETGLVIIELPICRHSFNFAQRRLRKIRKAYFPFAPDMSQH
jgi:hypothetical protein